LLRSTSPVPLLGRDFVHEYIEEIYIVEGSLTGTNLGEKFERHMYAYRKPRMVLVPFISEGGCLILIAYTTVEKESDNKGDHSFGFGL
jgi:hypothetical protein